jgi:opacity protein-like surface antigen
LGEFAIGGISLKKLLLATTALCFGSVETMAADIAVVPKAAPAIIRSWTGFYLGVHGGYGWGNNDFSVVVLNFDPLPPLAVSGIKSQGAVFGGQAGYNWQYGRVVAGVELDFSGVDIKGSSAASVTVPPAVAVASRTDEIKYLGTARARLGWLPTDSVLLYGTAGLGWERVDQALTQTQSTVVGGVPILQSITLRTPFDRFGWVAGAGAEVALWNTNWVGRIEYLHYDFGTIEETSRFVTTTPGGSTFDRAGRQTVEAVRAGLSYKFGVIGPAPSVLYTKAPVAAAQSSWAGSYLGVHGGYGWGDDRFSRIADFNPVTGVAAFINGPKSAGWVAGGHVGHNWQFERVVAGLELDLSGADIRGSSTSPLLTASGTLTFTDKVKYLGTARGRLGWLPTDNILLYGTAGLAWERIEQGGIQVRSTGGFTETSIGARPVDRFGWVAGVGAENLISGTNWVARIEYLHYDFGRASNTVSLIALNLPGIGSASLAESSGHQTIDVVRAGVSYKFGDPALAAAVPFTKALRMTPPSTWAGFYLGVHGGYGWKDNDFSLDDDSGPRIGGIKSRGWAAGGQGGYNWQYGRVVTGLEADFSVAGIKGDSDPLIIAGVISRTLSDNVKYLATSRGRLGWLPLDNVLLYGTAGPAWERVERTSTRLELSPPPTVSVTTTPRDHFGWVAGVGAETVLWNSNWIARLEYLHYDFGTVQSTQSFSSTNPTVTASADRGGRQTIELVRAGVSYKFGADSPVVAKY